MIRAGHSPFRERFFQHYLRWYLPRSFHTVHLTGSLGDFQDDGATPLLAVLNHSSWWDVLLGMYVESSLFGWERYGVMDERQLRRYRFFAGMGMIGVDRTSLGGAKEFLGYAHNLLASKHRSLWLTPQGAMLSNYTRPVRFQAGLSHIAATLDRFYFTSIALHYEFWDERLPEAFISVSPVDTYVVDSAFHRKRWLTEQETRMEAQLDALLDLTRRRDAAAFRPLLRGTAGVNALYDTFRAARARVTGEPFTAAHGDVVTPPWQPREVRDADKD